MEELRIDKTDGKVAYNDEHHIYWDLEDLTTYISATTIIRLFEQEFDEQFWLKYKAFQRLCNPSKDVLANIRLAKKFDVNFIKTLYPKATMTNLRPIMDEIKAEWVKTNRDACEMGTSIHAKYENIFNKEGYYQMSEYGLGSKDLYYYKPGEYELIKKNQVLPECLISMKTKSGVRVAGQIDLPVFKNPYIQIFDYKGLDVNTLILTPEGYRRMKSIKEGDTVYDMNGSPQTVLHKSESHYRDCFEFKFKDNPEPIICDDKHRWLASIDGEEMKVYEARELFEAVNSGKRVSIPNTKRLDIRNTKVKINSIAYAIYKIYNNTSANKRTVTSVKYNSMFNLANEALINSNIGGVKCMSGLSTVIKRCMNNKYVLAGYRNANLNSRLNIVDMFHEFLEYVKIDDYSCSIKVPKGMFEYAYSIITSVGGIVYDIKECPGRVIAKIKSTDRYLSIVLKIKTSKHETRDIEYINEVPTVETQCIEVSGDTHTYLAGECLTVTHNTNKKLNFESYKDNNGNVMMKTPLSHLMDCNMMHYALQLSLYSYMMCRKYPFLEVRTPKIIYAREENVFRFYDVPYLRKEVVDMLKYFRDHIIGKKFFYNLIMKKDGKYYLP